MVNVQLLKMGLETERLQYTLIGLPFYDLKKIFNDAAEFNTIARIVNWVVSEYHDVHKLLKI